LVLAERWSEFEALYVAVKVHATVAINPLPGREVRVEGKEVTFSPIMSDGTVEDTAAAPKIVKLRLESGE
jgi:hypothetical protein